MSATIYSAMEIRKQALEALERAEAADIAAHEAATTKRLSEFTGRWMTRTRECVAALLGNEREATAGYTTVDGRGLYGGAVISVECGGYAFSFHSNNGGSGNFYLDAPCSDHIHSVTIAHPYDMATFGRAIKETESAVQLCLQRAEQSKAFAEAQKTTPVPPTIEEELVEVLGRFILSQMPEVSCGCEH